MAKETGVPIIQVIHNYTANLPAFPPVDPDLLRLHACMAAFYSAFLPAAQALSIPDGEQEEALERAQKTLWFFGRASRLAQETSGTSLILDRQAAITRLKFPRPEETFTLLTRLGMQVKYKTAAGWSSSGKLKTSEALRLYWDLAPTLQKLVTQAEASSAKEKVVYERFLRANPQARVAREKPPLDLPPDAPAILANLPAPAAEAWQVLAGCLAGFEDFAPLVEFRSIHHGMWTVNYVPKRGSRDLCGLILQNGEMTVRIILYGAAHFFVKERLESFGDVITAAFHNAHYYEEFNHQWLFVPVRSVEDLAGIRKLLDVMPALLQAK